MSDTNFLTQLVAAQQALEAKPQLEAELARANGERDTIRTRFEAETAHSATLCEMLNSKGAEVEAKEAELKAATFREQQLRDQLTLLLGSLKGIVSESNTAIELVEPKPEPVVEAPIKNPTSATQESSLSTSSQEFVQDAGASDAVSVSSDPTQLPAMETGTDSTTGTTTTSVPIAATDPVDLPGKFPWETPKIGDVEDASYIGMSGYANKSDMEAARESEVNPTAGSTESGVDAISKNVAPTSAVVQDTSSPSTEETKYYWHKPASQTWGDWVDAGGELAPWLKNYRREELNFAF